MASKAGRWIKGETLQAELAAARGEVRGPGKPAIKDRKAIADHVMDWMHNHCRDVSIDTLLTWPNQAMAMGKAVCRKLHRKPTPEAIHEVCRAALSSRKRGDLKRDKY